MACNELDGASNPEGPGGGVVGKQVTLTYGEVGVEKHSYFPYTTATVEGSTIKQLEIGEAFGPTGKVWLDQSVATPSVAYNNPWYPAIKNATLVADYTGGGYAYAEGLDAAQRHYINIGGQQFVLSVNEKYDDTHGRFPVLQFRALQSTGWQTVDPDAMAGRKQNDDTMGNILKAVYPNGTAWKKASALTLLDVGATGMTTSLNGVYQANDGTVVVDAGGDFGARYGDVSLMLVFKDGKVQSVGVGVLDDHRNRIENPSDDMIAQMLEYFVGKDLAQIETWFENDNGGDLDTESGASTSNTQGGIMHSLGRAFALNDQMVCERLDDIKELDSAGTEWLSDQYLAKHMDWYIDAVKKGEVFAADASGAKLSGLQEIDGTEYDFDKCPLDGAFVKNDKNSTYQPGRGLDGKNFLAAMDVIANKIMDGNGRVEFVRVAPGTGNWQDLRIKDIDFSGIGLDANSGASGAGDGTLNDFWLQYGASYAQVAIKTLDMAKGLSIS